MKKEPSARWMLICSMVIFGTIGLFRKAIPLPSGIIAMSRGYVGAAFLLLILLLKKQRLNMQAIKQNLWLPILSGAAMGFNWIALFESYNYTSVAAATLCYYMAPIFLVLTSPLVLKERLTVKKLLCALISFVGIILVSGVTGMPSSDEIKGVLLGLGAAVLYASVILMNKRMKPIPAFDKTILQLGSAAVVLNVYAAVTGQFAGFSPSLTVIALLSVVCIIHTGLAYAMYFRSMESLSGHTLAVMSYIDPVVAVILSALVLREEMTVPSAIGAVLVLSSAVFSELSE